MRRGNFIYKNIHLRTRRNVSLTNLCVEFFGGDSNDPCARICYVFLGKVCLVFATRVEKRVYYSSNMIC